MYITELIIDWSFYKRFYYIRNVTIHIKIFNKLVIYLSKLMFAFGYWYMCNLTRKNHKIICF